MKWLLILLLFPFYSFAQTHKPGVYRDLKVEKPIVLDTGSYTFIGLDMKNLGKGVWLDGRKAKRLTLQGCRFEGNGIGTAMITNGNAQIVKSIFTNMETGIQVLANEGTIRTLTLTANTFTNLRCAIDLQKEGAAHGDAQFDLSLRCNEFVSEEQTGTPLPRIGLRMGEGVALNGPIGNDGVDENANPSGNVWPIDPASLMANPVSNGPGVIANWLSPEGWTSLRNENQSAILEYWAFNNEFVWPETNNLQLTRVRTRIQGSEEELMMYRQGTVPPPDEEGVVRYIEQCTADLPNVFPLPLRQAVYPVTTSWSLVSEKGSMPILGDAIPNLARNQAQIPVFIPTGSAKSYSISLFDLTGKSILLQMPIYETGQVKISISLKDIIPGVYGYSLLEDGKSLGARKLVILK